VGHEQEQARRPCSHDQETSEWEEAARRKEHKHRNSDGLPVQSFQCLLKDLATLCKNRVCWESSPDAQFDQLTLPTDLQRRAFDLLGLAIGM